MGYVDRERMSGDGCQEAVFGKTAGEAECGVIHMRAELSTIEGELSPYSGSNDHPGAFSAGAG